MDNESTAPFKNVVFEVYKWSQSLEPPAGNFKMDFKYEDIPGYKISLVFEKL